MSRKAQITRKTRETEITAGLSPDGGDIRIHTGVGFFDHMLYAMAFHAGWGLTLEAKGDLEVDGHHTVEDAGIVLGQALREAVGDKAGVERFGSAYVPMDEALGFAAADLSGRAYLSYDCASGEGGAGDYDPALTREFFRAFVVNAGLTLHVKVTGGNTHHMTEALFKAAGRALRAACRLTGTAVASAKGVL